MFLPGIFFYFSDGLDKPKEIFYNGTLHFKKDAPDLNIIYGYLQIGNMMNDKESLQNNVSISSSFLRPYE